ncbi:ribosome maturation factor RimM [Neisseria leonii]|uniref:Ribosome maturation factor RimM n=1 Tax=Neisseria leonii TaxID=2995413 RepID=A0A9X4E2W3_9NEIS|nr:ribosome maturation factor RimM [Neisseria sp. 51.81]MDD9328610.1 ribosome maturation factor RimM [Neisseria sp. 51.81]
MDSRTQWVAMGYVKGVFGIKGWVKISADTEYTDSLLDYPEWRLVKDGRVQTLTVEAGKLNSGELHVKFQGIDDRDSAFALRGHTIEIARSDFAPAEDDEYYWADLVGMTVINRSGETLGSVKNLMATGAHDILVIEGSHGSKLIPFVAHFIDSVDQQTRTITADWGLDY